MEAAVEGFGDLDVLVNNAGRGGGAAIDDFTEELWDRIIDTNLKGTFFTIQAAVPHLRPTKGNIVNIASVNGMTGVVRSTAYGPSKAGVINMTKCLAKELAPDVRVNAVCPGGVDTDMLQNLSPATSRTATGSSPGTVRNGALPGLTSLPDRCCSSPAMPQPLRPDRSSRSTAARPHDALRHRRPGPGSHGASAPVTG